MNQGRFRLVFNRLRGMMVAVAEFASAHGKGEAAVNPNAPESVVAAATIAPSPALWFAARTFAFAALCVFGLQPLLVEPAHAQANLPVAPDRNASGPHPVVGVAGNGVPVVNIVAPNAAGTSHNKYTDYNVGQKGLILNNSGQNSQTQTAGWVQGNPFMGNKSARTILNEVTSGNRSQLLGMTEVAGHAANVIIANPAGIYCNGCGFIAAPRVTLSTGVPVLDASGALARLNVAQGGITIDGLGLDTRGASQADLIARAMEINGQIWAQQLNATTGANQVSYIDGAATPIQGTGPRPVVAIDVSALGSMYGNNAVRLVGTELGVGVNLGGTLNSLTGDIQVTNNGDVTINPKGALLASNNAQVSATSISNAGTVATDGQVALIAAGTLTNTGMVTARTNLSGTGQNVVNTGTLAGGIATDGTVNASGSVSAIASGGVQNSGAIQGGQDVLVQAASADLSNGWIHAGNVATLAVAGDALHANATLDAHSLDIHVGGTLANQHGSIASQTPLVLAVGALDNRGGAVSSQGSLDVNAASVQNAAGQLVAQQDVAVHAANIGNQGGTIGSVTGATKVSANVLDNSSGTISAAQAINVNANTLTNAQGQISGDSLNLTAATLDTHGGTIVAVHDAHVSATGDLNNSAGTIGSQQSSASITAGGALVNVGGTIASAINTAAQARSLDNSSGTISAGQHLNVTVDSLLNAAGQISGDQVKVAGNTLDTHAGQIIAVHDVKVSASNGLNNSAGTIGSQQGNARVAAGGALSNANGTIAGAAASVTAAAFDNSSGIVSATQAASVQAASVTNANGQIGGDTIRVVTNALDTRSGKIIGTHDVNVQSQGNIDNSSGTIGSQAASVTVAANGALMNTGGTITSSGDTSVSATALDNSNGVITAVQQTLIQAANVKNANGQIGGDTVNVAATSLDTHAGKIIAVHDATVTAASELNNSAGTIGSQQGNASVSAGGALMNNGGTITSNGNTTARAQSLDNANGVISASQAAKIDSGALTNSAGQISGDTVTLTAASLDTHDGQIVGVHDLNVSATGDLDNAGGTIGSQEGNATITAGGALSNANGGLIASAGNTTVSAQSIDNTAGSISAARAVILNGPLTSNARGEISGDTVDLHVDGALNNQSGRIVGTHATRIDGATRVDNTAGTLGTALGDFSLAVNGAVRNVGGTIASGENTTVSAQSFDNTDGTFAAANQATLAADSVVNARGQISANAVQVHVANALDNTAGEIASASTTQLDAADIDNSAGQISGQDVRVKTATLTNDQGAITAGKTLALDTAWIGNRAGSLTSAGTAIVSASNDIDNSGGTLAANGDMRVSANNLSNADGVIGSVAGALTVNTAGTLNNDAGTLAAATTSTLNTVAVTNRGGTISGQSVTVLAQSADNSNGAMVGTTGDVSIDASQGLTNAQGVIQAAGALNVQSHGAALDNRGGLITGATQVAVDAGQLDNSAQGAISSSDTLRVHAANLANDTGSITAQNALNVSTDGALSSRSGTLGSNGDATLTADSVDNDSGLIHAGGALAINARTIANANTGSATANQGIEGGTVALTTTALDNTAGAIRSDQWTAINTGTLNNSQGEIASTGALDITATADVTNTLGDLNGGTHTNVTARALTGDGTIQSQGDVNLALQSDFINTGSVQADHDVTLNTSGNLDNRGAITAGNALTLAGQNVTNTATGVIAGQSSTHVIAAQDVRNDGLINGGDTRIDAQSVTNTGRIYGDSIAVSANTLTNDINAQGTAGVIASRGDIDLGVGTLTNREGAYILANDDLRIGGALDASGHATGSARQVTNDSATIEAGGNLTIDAGHIDNLNSHFATTTTTTNSTTPQYFYTQTGSDALLPAADTWFYLNERNHLHALMPGTINPKDAWQTQTEYWTMLLPSTQYPQARYGPPFNYDGDTTPNRNGEDVQLGKGFHSIPFPVQAGGRSWTTAYPVGLAYAPETTYQTGSGESGQTVTAPEAFAYTPGNPIWAVFGVSPPAPLPTEPTTTCKPSDAACAAQHAAWDSAHTAYVAQYQALNDAIAAFDTDFASRLVSNFDMVTVNTQTTTEDSVISSAPGQILAGGDLSINGSLNNDKSQIAAGGDFNGTGPQTINADALGVKRTVAEGTVMASQAQGGGRKWSDAAPFSKTLDDQVINLPILPTTAGVTPGTIRSVPVASATAQGAGGAVGIASGTAQGVSLNGVSDAGGIDGVNIAPGTAGAIHAPGASTVNAPGTGALNTPSANVNAATPASTGPTAALGGEVIRTMTPPLRLPNNALYRTQSDPGSHYLIETDPAYANFRTWISSDTMIRALNQSPDNVIKRIGDGFYEQQLVAQQVLTLTGQRFIGDYTSNEAEYKALLNGGVQAAQAFSLTIGTALTDAQMAALTSDIVWLVKQTVTLADGSTQEVLTPQVYLHAREMDVTGTGALISGKNVSIQNSGDVSNSGTIASRGVSIVSGETVSNVNGTLAGSTLIAHANTDLTNLAGKIVADNALLTAGRDITIGSQSWSATGLNTATSGIGAVSTINAGNLAIGAGHDLTITASALNATGNLALAAVNDVNLKTLTISDSLQSTWDSKNQRGTSQSADVGASINAGGDVSIAAGHDVNATAANVVAGNALNVAAGHDIDLNAGTQSRSVSEDHYSESHGFLSRTKTTTHDANGSTDAIGTTLSGDTVNVLAGHDLTAKAATIAGTGDVNLWAGNNLTITTAATSSLDTHSKETKKSGFGSGGGLSFGTSSQKDMSQDTVAGEQGSLIGSTDGSVHMQAGNTLHVTGSDIVAAQDVTGIGANVTIDGSQTNRHHDETHESKTTGFSLTASAPVIDAAQNTLQQAGASGRSEDSRASALHAMAAASGAYDTALAAGGAAQDLASGKMPEAKIELSWGSSSSKSTFTEDRTNNTGSTVKAGGTAAFVATGQGPNQGNVNIAGSDVNASNVILSAANQVNLTNSTDTDSTRSTNESKSAGVGVSVGTGGFGVDASMSKANGRANSDSTVQNNTHVNAANNVTIVSGGDTNVIGANVNGKSVNMDVGGDLNIASIQDTSTSRAHQDSTGGGFAISSSGASGSFNHSAGNASGDYRGVEEQSGIHAGTDGFAITVHGNTDLKGGVIASDATADKTTLTTGTLSFSDIQNNSSYDANSFGITAGGGVDSGGNNYATHGSESGKNTGGILPTFASGSGSSSATTQSAISAGTITITDTANQVQDVATLNRDTSNTNGTVSKLPDVNNLLDRQADMMSAIGAAAEAVSRRIGDYADSKMQAAQAAGDQAGVEAWKDGGTSRALMQAAGGALVGGLGGGVGSAVGGAAGAGVASMSAGKLNELSDSIANSSPTGNADMDRMLGNIVANVIATGAGAAVGGGAGATSAANVDRYNRQLHPDEKQAIANKANGDKAEQDKLTKAACLAVKCWAQYAPGSDQYNANYVSQLEASQLGPEVTWVNQQKEAGLFAYTPVQKIGDAVQNDPFGAAKDASKVVIGGVTAKAGAGLCATGAGCVPGTAMIAFGLSDMAEGADGLYNRYNGINSPGVNPLRWGFNQALPAGWGDIAYDGLNVAGAILALKAPVPLKMGVADGLNRPGSMFDVMVPNINNNRLIPFVNQALPYGTNRAILLFGVGSKGATVINDIRRAGDQK